MDTVNQISAWLSLIGGITRPFGALAIGIALGWLATLPFIEADKKWQLQIAALLGLMGAFVTLNIYSGAGTTGMFALGAGIMSIVTVVRATQKPKDTKETKAKG